MTIVRFVPLAARARVDFGPHSCRRDPELVACALLKLGEDLRLHAKTGRSIDLQAMINTAASNGAFEILILLRDLQYVRDQNDHVAEAALMSRLVRQITADIEFVHSQDDPTGQHEF